MVAGSFQVEFQGAAQVPQHGGLTMIGIGQHLVVKFQVSGFGHIGGHGVKEPQTIIGAVLFSRGALLVTGTMFERLDDGHSPTIGQLAGEHQFQARPGLPGNGGEYPQHILDRVAKA